MDKAPARTLAAASLAALVHLVSLAAIALLLLNDHLLKHEVPSALTGKLSDFAGLYFLPYVSLALVFALLSVGRSSWSGHAIAAATYCVIGLLFAILKTSADASDIFITSVSALTGVRISFVTDPTDLVALISLPTSYVMWARQLSRAPLKTSAARVSLRVVVLSLAAIAIVATSSPPSPSITSVAADQIDGARMYAVVEYAGANDGVYSSADDGTSWSRTATSTGTLVADPLRAGVLYLIDSASQSGLLRIRTPDGTSDEIGPYAKGAGYTNNFGLTYLRIGAWPSPVLYFVRGGYLWTSSDDGTVWQSVGLGGPVYAVAPTATPNLVYAATDGYFMRSVDGGRVWTHDTVISGVAGQVSALVAHRDDSQLLLAGVGKALRRTTDGGMTWQTRFQYGGSTTIEFARWTLVFDPGDPDRAYALFGGGCCPAAVSTDRGLTWKEWGEAVITLVPSGDHGHPLLALTPFRTRVLRHEGAPPGAWQSVGETLPLGR